MIIATSLLRFQRPTRIALRVLRFYCYLSTSLSQFHFSMKTFLQLLPAVSLGLIALTQAAAAQEALHAMQTVKLERGAKQYIGALLAEDDDNYVLLQRDGRMKVVSRSGSSHPTPLLDS
ncbi:MAG: hypothetical protein ACKO9H_02885, partial [Planctomycetota bacterium]